VPLEEAKIPLLWWSKHERLLSTVGYLSKAILSITGSQIETKRMFSVTRILTNLLSLLTWVKELGSLSFFY
jgi:hypothetical protein